MINKNCTTKNNKLDFPFISPQVCSNIFQVSFQVSEIQRLLLNFVGFVLFAGVGIVSAITWMAAKSDDSGNSTAGEKAQK